MGKLKKFNKELYNAIPVFYCKQCLSLRIKSLPGTDDIDFCDECNSTNIESTDIFTWQQMYKDRYGNNYLNLSNNGREEK